MSVRPFVLPAPPSANRWWRNVNGRMVKSEAARQYQANTMALAGPQRCIPAPTPIRIMVCWYRAAKRGDLDKRLGVLLDALQGICYESDAQIVEIHAYRLEDESRKGRVEISVEELPDARST